MIEHIIPAQPGQRLARFHGIYGGIRGRGRPYAVKTEISAIIAWQLDPKPGLERGYAVRPITPGGFERMEDAILWLEGTLWVTDDGEAMSLLDAEAQFLAEIQAAWDREHTLEFVVNSAGECRAR